MKYSGKCSECDKFNTLATVGVPAAPKTSEDGGGQGQALVNRLAPRTREGERSEHTRVSAPISWTGSSSGAPRSIATIGNTPRRRNHVLKLEGRTGQEINRVLGEGVSPGAVVLVAGDPGVGKSTLMLQIGAMVAHPELNYDELAEEAYDGGADAELAAAGAALVDGDAAADGDPGAEDGDGGGGGDEGREAGARAPAAVAEEDLRRVLYVTGEEDEEQVHRRACRMGLGGCERLYLQAENNLDDILTYIERMRPTAVILDSIQTMYLPSLTNSPGSVTQVRECCSAITRMAKSTGVAFFVTGHVTKGGDIGGPSTMEHMVDAVLFMEQEVSGQFRMLRARKNRNGDTGEVGYFKMDKLGLHGTDTSEMFFSTRSGEVGLSAITVFMNGNRPRACEVQALCTYNHFSKSAPVRNWSGVSKERMSVLLPVLSKFVPAMQLHRMDINVGVIGGYHLKESAADLAIALAITSSYFKVPLSTDMAAIGEVDLAGALRPVYNTEARLGELDKMGFKYCMVPQMLEDQAVPLAPEKGLKVAAYATLLQALEAALGAANIATCPHKRGGAVDSDDDGGNGAGWSAQDMYGDGDIAEEEEEEEEP